MTADQPENRPLRVAIWCAVSSRAQATERKTSLSHQEQTGRDFAAAISGHVVRVYTIPGHTRDLIFWSDAETQMDAYRQLRLDCANHTFDLLHATDPDRLGRDPALSHQVISLVESSGAEIYLASAPHPVGQATVANRYIYAIQTVRAKEDQTRRVQHHRAGVSARVRRGLPACQWPLGYVPVRDPTTGAVIGGALDPHLAPVVELATRLFLQATSYHDIAAALNNGPYLPPRAARWSYSTVRRILNNDTYAGYPHWLAACPSEPSPHYPALWDPQTHARVITERARRKEKRHRYQKPQGSPIAGICHCGRCGGSMTRHRGGGHHHYYLRCSRHARQAARGEPCHANYIRESAVIAAIGQRLVSLAQLPNLPHLLATGYGHNDAAPRQLASITRHITDLEERRQRLAHALAAGLMDPQVYRAADDQILADHHELTAARADLEQLISNTPDPAAISRHIHALAANFTDVVATRPAAEVRAALQKAGFRVEVEAGAITMIEPPPSTGSGHRLPDGF